MVEVLKVHEIDPDLLQNLRGVMVRKLIFLLEEDHLVLCVRKLTVE